MQARIPLTKAKPKMNDELQQTLEGSGGADFRVRVAREKRERMRKRLMSAALDVFLLSPRTKPPVIEDVILKAGVSRGTFYKYYDSLEEVLTELGQLMADEMIGTYERVFAGLQDPAARVVAGPLISLTHAGMQPRRAEFTVRVDYVDYLSRSNRLMSIVTCCLREAKASGVVQFESLDVATDYIIGATIQGSRRITHEQKTSDAYRHELVVMIMRGFGMQPEAASQAIEIALAELNLHAADLPWWQT